MSWLKTYIVYIPEVNQLRRTGAPPSPATLTSHSGSRRFHPTTSGKFDWIIRWGSTSKNP